MVFGMSEKQKLIMAYLYKLKDTPESPPDLRLSVGLIAKNLGMKQREVRKETRGLIKRHYVGSIVVEKRRYYYLTLRGTREMEKFVEKSTEWEFGSQRIGIKKKKKEII